MSSEYRVRRRHPVQHFPRGATGNHNIEQVPHCHCLKWPLLKRSAGTGSSVRAEQTRGMNSAKWEKVGRFPRFISGGKAKSTAAESGTASDAKHNLFKWLERLCWFWEEPFGESRSMCRDFKQPLCQGSGFQTGLVVWLKPRRSTITLRGNGEGVRISSASVLHIPLSMLGKRSCQLAVRSGSGTCQALRPTDPPAPHPKSLLGGTKHHISCVKRQAPWNVPHVPSVSRCRAAASM